MNTGLDDATLNSLFWIGANYHRPVDLPDTTGLSWREGILWCLESVRPRSRTSPPSSPSAVPHSSLPPSAAPLSSPPAPAPELLDSALPPEFSGPILTPVPVLQGPLLQCPFLKVPFLQCPGARSSSARSSRAPPRLHSFSQENVGGGALPGSA